VLPAGVTATVADGVAKVKGPKGELTLKIARDVSVSVEGNVVTCERSSETKQAKSNHGTMRALIASMANGVSEGYQKNLDIIGVGYGAVSGYVGGAADNVMMRIVDIIYSLPYMFFVINSNAFNIFNIYICCRIL
jgi:ribosomal protein L6P/L9E